MLDVDILSAFVICGAASCVAALMTALARSEEAHVAAGLRICSVGFAVLGLALVQLVFGVDGPTSGPMLVTLMGSSLGVGLCAWGLARLAGERVPPPAAAAVLLGVVGVQALAWQAGAWPLSMTFLITMTAMSLLAALALRNFILARPAPPSASWAWRWSASPPPGCCGWSGRRATTARCSCTMCTCRPPPPAPLPSSTA